MELCRGACFQYARLSRCGQDGRPCGTGNDGLIGGMAMYDFEAEYRGLFEKPLEEIQQDIFFRADNFRMKNGTGNCRFI